ncbi:vacuolar protein sorting-associated protein 53 homolog [Planococcus citri]|uniref:vacuolar protein sorting-associated protein 53 homolog n=1 Tax=Planococcus citri TaxID=170843 RepID=UPI0031F78134
MPNQPEDDDFFEEIFNEFELIKFSDEVQNAIEQVVPSDDTLDVADFNPIDYINSIFPTEQSLSNIDQVISNMETKVYNIDTEIRNVVRQQTNMGQDGRSALLDAQKVINQLLIQIREIKCKAESSEEMVREITQDIKQLDCAKRNLTTAITTLNHLHMLVAGVDSLKNLIKNRQYREIVMPLQGITEVIKHFSNFKDISQINQLSAEVREIQISLAEQITADFRNAFSGSNTKNFVLDWQLAEACLVVSILDPKVKKDLLKWFIDLQLSEYVHLFHEAEDVAWIDKLDRRYAWFKKHLLNIEDKFGAMFPADWELSEQITVEFCSITRSELSRIMGKRKNEIDVKLLLFAIQRTKNFENLLSRRFSGITLLSEEKKQQYLQSGSQNQSNSKLDFNSETDSLQETADSGNTQKESEMEMESPFNGIIGQCFFPHLYVYINSVDRNLFELIERFATDTKAELDREDATCETSPAIVLSSSADLFLFYKKSLVQCKELSNQQPMLSLANTFQKYLREYATKILQNNLPKLGNMAPSLSASVTSITRELRDFSAAGLIRDFSFRTQSDTSKYTTQELSRICCILSTAEYCLETTQQLEEKLKEKIDVTLREKINMSQEQDIFHNIISTCIQFLVQDLEIACEPALTAMTKIQWQNLESVGDQSSYVNAIVAHLKSVVPLVRTKLSSSRKYFTQFCIKFANSFIPKFIQHIHKCKLSTVGAEQLLLDTHSLKIVLQKLPSIDSQVNREPPSSYTKVVLKGMTKAENILKVVMTPQEPDKTFVDQFLRLLPESDVSEFQKILDMKGLRTAEKNNLTALFHPHNPSFVTGSHTSSPKHDTSNVRKLDNLIKKFN